MILRVGRAASMQGTFRPPSDKSLTHRAYMFGAIAEGPSTVHSPLMAADCDSTLTCLSQLGVLYERTEDQVRLFPKGEWRQSDEPLDCGNSGTTMRLLAGLIASRPIKAVLTGDESLSRRPMKRIAEPLRKMGAKVEGDTPPLLIQGQYLKGIRYQSSVASAQVKSAVLLAGLRASGETWLKEPFKSRDHTERMLGAMGVELLHDDGWIGLKGGARLKGFDFTVPGDISSAAFMMVAAALLPESNLNVMDLGVNPTRSGLLDVFEQAAVNFALEGMRDQLGEPVADVNVRFTPDLKPYVVEGPLVPRLIDELPILAVLASQCEGTSYIRDAAELRVKESDRIELIAENLRAMGGNIVTKQDGFEIKGPTKLEGAELDAEGDHRIAMAFAVAGLIAEGATEIHGAEGIATSFPMFESELWRLCVV